MKRRAVLLLPAVAAAMSLCALCCKSGTLLRDHDVRYTAIIIDPGHGGRFPGAVHGGLCEDEINYDISLRLYNRLKEHNKSVFMTVKDNAFPRPSGILSCDRSEVLWNGRMVTMKERIALIRELDPGEKALLISIHINSLPAVMRGFSVYCPRDGERRMKESRDIAGRLSRSLVAGKVLPLSMGSGIFTWSFDPVRPRIYRWNFVPAIFSGTGNRAVVLCELGNIRNAEDREMLSSPRYRELLAQRLYEALLPVLR